MEQRHRKAIQTNFLSLVARTDLDAMVTALYEKGVFSEQMIEQYRSNNGSSTDRKRNLYMDIMCRGPHAFGHLVDALSELGYWDLVTDLDPSNPFSSVSRPAISNPSQVVSSRDLNPEESGGFRSLVLSNNRTKTEQQKSNAPPPQLPESQATVSHDLDNAAGDMGEVTLEVIKSTTFIEDDENNDLKLYRTRGRNRGVMLIFSYVSFQNDIDNNRHGADIDCAMLKTIFSEIGFKVISYLDLNYQETIETLRSLENVIVDVECVFTVVSSHGYERRGTTDIDIRCSDGGLISFYEIMSYFDNKTLPRLIGIPKVFVFQVCRGSNQDYMQCAGAPPRLLRPRGSLGADVGAGARPDGARAAVARPAPAAPAAARRIPLYSDILIAHSTLPGFASFRNSQRGSWYIQTMCRVFAERAHNAHVDKLFTLVDQSLRDNFKVQTSSVDRWGFNKRLYLHPGLFQ